MAGILDLALVICNPVSPADPFWIRQTGTSSLQSPLETFTQVLFLVTVTAAKQRDPTLILGDSGSLFCDLVQVDISVPNFHSDN